MPYKPTQLFSYTHPLPALTHTHSVHFASHPPFVWTTLPQMEEQQEQVAQPDHEVHKEAASPAVVPSDEDLADALEASNLDDDFDQDDQEDNDNDNDDEGNGSLEFSDEAVEDDAPEDDDFGDFDDFDDFEEGPPDESFTTEPIESSHHQQPAEPPAAAATRVPCLSETDFANSVTLQAAIAALLGGSIPMADAASFAVSDVAAGADNSDGGEGSATEDLDSVPTIAVTPSVAASAATTPAAAPTERPSYFTERSHSLWNQLALVPPQATATDWKRSSIRRLFMVSLGVPLDLDEILPQKNTKKLVLPAVRQRRRSRSRSRSRQDPASKTATNSKSANSKTGSTANTPPTPEDDNTDKLLMDWSQLAAVSDLARGGMSHTELASHINALKSAMAQAQAMQAQWETKKAGAVKDKQDFEGLIESLVAYAQRAGKGGKKKK